MKQKVNESLSHQNRQNTGFTNCCIKKYSSFVMHPRLTVIPMNHSVHIPCNLCRPGAKTGEDVVLLLLLNWRCIPIVFTVIYMCVSQ